MFVGIEVGLRLRPTVGSGIGVIEESMLKGFVLSVTKSVALCAPEGLGAELWSKFGAILGPAMGTTIGVDEGIW